mmetsp:Transcript_36806/g.98814  ORF Transcript_36806/g.98814 Transcript_36806/m.98814 type:complete len:98 (-) Transcript_36806:2003-2296(-)
MASAPPPMTPERAKNILRDTITTLGTEENKARIQAVLDEVAAAPEEEQGMLKMSKMVPLVTELAGGKLQVPVGWCHTFCYSTFRAHRAATLLLPSLK